MAGKMKLDLDGLNVETFEAEAQEAARRGTVRGNEEMVSIDTCYDYTCRGYGTCGIYPCKPVP
ncbi:MAG TPA: hypothetical protein VFJ16_23335 [Longimicrobium sp.]|nr:hypothetical protein [Longimicrobium sp.]